MIKEIQGNKIIYGITYIGYIEDAIYACSAGELNMIIENIMLIIPTGTIKGL